MSTAAARRAARDAGLLLAARGLRLFAYGFLSVVLAVYLASAGLSAGQIGALFTVALAGGAVVTVALSTLADRWGRRGTLIVSSVLMGAGGAALASSDNFFILLVVAAFGTFSPSGQEVGAFQSLEQAALAQTSERVRVRVYAWYNLVGYLAAALGGLAVGVAIPALRCVGWSEIEAQRALVWAFAGAGLALLLPYAAMSAAVETRPVGDGSRLGLRQSRGVVWRLSALFGLDALAGGLVIQSLVAFWFNQRFGVGAEQLGPLFFGTNLMSGLSFLVAARLAERFGLLNTMVFTHMPSNVLLALVPFMPSWQLAGAVLIARHALAQMDVPTRQAYTMILVAPDERAAAAGFTNAVRTAAASVAPAISGLALQAAASGLPFVLAGGLKIVYDLTLWLTFRRVPLPEGASRSAG